MAVLVNVIGAVESGGQVYGQRNYAAYTLPYTNSLLEHTITLGWAQNYGNEARKLIQMILDKMGEAAFRQVDTDGSIYNMRFRDWVSERWKPTDAQRKVLIALITSKEGKECQDELFSRNMELLVADCAAKYTTNVKAQMMYCEIRHLGGLSPVNRIFDRCSGNYDLDNILAALIRDQKDTSSNNQVGDQKYWSRHVKCRQFIDQYAMPEDTAEKGKEVVAVGKSAADKACDWMEQTARDNSHGYDQIYRWGEKGDYDCSAAVITAYEKAGVPVKTKGATYTGNMKSVFLKCGFRDVTSQVNLSTGAGLKRGDVLLNEARHTAMYCGNGQEVEASINEKGTATGGKPGDQTGREFLIRSYRNYPWNCVLRYGDGGTGSGTGTTEGGCYMFSTKEIQKGSQGADVLLLQSLLRGKGFKGADKKALTLDGDFGDNTDYALKNYQTKKGLDADGCAGSKTWASIIGL